MGLVLDKTVTNKKWKLVCSNESCLTVVSIFKGEDKVAVLEETCSKCGVYLMIANKGDASKEKKGCVFCDFKANVKQAIGKSNTQKERHKEIKASGGRGRGRGRGRGVVVEVVRKVRKR